MSSDQKRGQADHSEAILRQRIMERMAALGVSANYVSIHAGLDRGALGKFLRESVGALRDASVRKIAHVLDCHPSYLRGETDEVGGHCASSCFGKPDSGGVSASAIPCPGNSETGENASEEASVHAIPVPSVQCRGTTDGVVSLQVNAVVGSSVAAQVADLVLKDWSSRCRARTPNNDEDADKPASH